MSTGALILLLALAFVLSLTRGVVTTFALLYLPVQLLFSTIAPMPLPGIPNMGSETAIIYGMLLALVVKGGETLPFRWNLLDTLLVALSVASVISAVTTEYLYTGVSTTGTQFLRFLGPYFLGRIAFSSPDARRTALWSCVICMGVIGFFALIEMRLFPFFYGRALEKLGLYSAHTTMVFWRLGLMRAQTAFSHPIDMGNACTMAAALIALLAATTRVGLRNPLVLMGMAAAAVGLLASLSWTSYLAAAAILGLFLMLYVAPNIGKVLPLIVILLIAGGVWLSFDLRETGANPAFDPDNPGVHNSMMMRAVIVHRSWPFVTSAGFFGWGATISRYDLNLDSVDNAYILMTMTRGWVYLAIFLTIPLVLAWRGARAYARCVSPQQRLPLTIALATVLGMMVGMFTVWFGFVYAQLWLVILGMSVSLIEVLLAAATVPQRGVVAPPAMRPAYANLPSAGPSIANG